MRTRNAKLRLRESNSNRMTIGSNLLLIVGTCITLAALVYMIVNLDKADSIITMWIFLLAVGILLMFWGLFPFIRSFQNKTIGKHCRRNTHIGFFFFKRMVYPVTKLTGNVFCQILAKMKRKLKIQLVYLKKCVLTF